MVNKQDKPAYTNINIYNSSKFLKNEFVPSSQSRSSRTVLVLLHFCKTEHKHIDTNHILRYETSLTEEQIPLKTCMALTGLKQLTRKSRGIQIAQIISSIYILRNKRSAANCRIAHVLSFVLIQPEIPAVPGATSCWPHSSVEANLDVLLIKA